MFELCVPYSGRRFEHAVLVLVILLVLFLLWTVSTAYELFVAGIGGLLGLLYYLATAKSFGPRREFALI